MSWENTVLPSLQWLHKARTTKQFTTLSDIVIAQLQSDNETDYAKWLKNEYLDDRWHAWFVTASGCPGVSPNQNPMEAHHKKIKTSNVLSLRASTAYVLRQSLPSILTMNLNTAQSDSQFHLFAADQCRWRWWTLRKLCQKDTHRVVFRPRTNRRDKKAVVFNGKAYRVGDNNLNGIAVTVKRVRTYMKSLIGELKNDGEVKDISIDYLSLHNVEILQEVPYEHYWESPNWSMDEIRAIRNKYKCDGKAQYTSGWICNHVLATLDLLDNFDLARMLKRLPARRPPDRPRKVPRALQRYGEALFGLTRPLRELPKTPATALNWKCSVEFEERTGNSVSFENYTGRVCSWSNRGGIYHWKVEFRNGVVRRPKVEVLAKAIEYADSTGVAVAGP